MEALCHVSVSTLDMSVEGPQWKHVLALPYVTLMSCILSTYIL